jgi:hypothetical protein
MYVISGFILFSRNFFTVVIRHMHEITTRAFHVMQRLSHAACEDLFTMQRWTTNIPEDSVRFLSRPEKKQKTKPIVV